MTIQKINLEKDDVILVEIDPEIMDLNTAREICLNLQKEFPENKMIAYLKGTSIHITKEKDFEYMRTI